MTSQLLVVVSLTLAVIPRALPAPAPSAPPAARSDPAARGVDLFVHTPDKVAAGGRLPVQVRVFGFPQVTKLEPLAGATIEATWDAESLGEKVASAPPVVSAKSDADGRAHLDIDVPHGAGQLKLLLSARFGEHQRTRELAIERLPARAIDLRVSDEAVVPGGTLSAWAFVRDAASGKALARVPVDFELNGRNVARFSRRLTTDDAGMVALPVAVPFTEDPDAGWTLTARTASDTDDDVSAVRSLHVREETPGLPSLAAHWKDPSARPGTRTRFRVEARDGTREPLARLPFRYWVGPRGTVAPEDDAAWERASTPSATDGAGVAAIDVDTPSTIARRGSTLTVVVHANAQGHALAAQDTLALEAPRPELELLPEFGALLPGQPQRLFVHATFGGAALAAVDLALEGHGLSARMRTNERGWGEVTWRVPREIGATVPARLEGACAGEVAATVHVRPIASLSAFGAHPEPFAICVKVDRDATAAIRPERPIVRADGAVPVRLVGDAAAAPSVVLMAPDRAEAASGWMDHGSASVRAPDGASGLWTISAAASNHARGGAAGVLTSNVLVVPTLLPRLRAWRSKTPARSGTVEIEADLDAGPGQFLTGSVGAVVVDARGGGHVEGLLALDTRRALVAGFGVAAADIDGFLDGDASFDSERWAALARSAPEPLAAAVDPVASADVDIEQAFSAIVRSLEGGVFEASGNPERLRDVRIRASGRSALNPEMMTLTTEAMPEAPTTPGGEPWRLADLMQVDRQVTYDNVARRVTRLKLFRVLSAIRDYVHEEKLDADEPMLRDPNALLRRMVRGETLQASDLLDPWAHSLVFVHDSGPRVPFLSVVSGQRLISAGPDGRVGTADDVRDPFQRVLASKTPYAKAVDEDRLVDARWDMRVGDDTVAAWKETLEKVTGSQLGGSDEIGFGNLGTTGSGYGSGAGGLGGLGRGRSTHGIDVGPAVWLPPVRTDNHGHVRLTVPLPDGETTWQIVLVGVPDHGSPAVTSVDVPVTLPLSVAVRTGAAWIVGDRVGVALELRNRTEHALSVSLRVSASGAAALADRAPASRAIALPAGAAVTATAFVVASAVGTGILDVSASAAGVAPDAVHHEWAIRPAGERSTIADAVWVDRAATLPLPSAAADGASPTEPGRLILERGPTAALAAVLESVQSERLHGARPIADALEICGRIRTWAIVRGGEGDPLAVRARAIAAEVANRLGVRGKDDPDAPSKARAQLWRAVALPPSPGDDAPTAHHRKSSDDCPPQAPSMLARLAWLDGAPRAERGAEPACWAAFIGSTLQQLAGTSDPLQLARATIAVGDRPGYAIVAGALADRLRASAPVGADGTVGLPGGYAGDLASRSIVMAALVRARHLGAGAASSTGAPAVEAAAGRLWTRLLLDREAGGGYGSIQATRIVLPALLATSGATASALPPATIDWSEVARDGSSGPRHRLTLGAAEPVSVALSATAVSVRLEASPPGLIARIERAALRPFSRTTEAANGPLHLDVQVPRAPRAGITAPLQLSVSHDLGRQVPVVVRIPLPPGAALAEPVSGVRQVQGALYVSMQLDSDPLPRVVEIPLRFALSGAVTWPETVGRIDDDELPPTRAPARPLVVDAAR